MQSGREGETEGVGRPLRHEESLGSRVLRSIDPAWLADHKDLLDLLASPNEPPAVEATPQSTEPMDVEYGFQSQARRMPLTERTSSRQQSPEEPGTSPPVCDPQFMSTSERLLQKQNVLPGLEDVSPVADAPHRQACSASLQIPRTSRRGSRSERSTGRHSEDRRLSGLVPEVSLAARAGSLGATSLQTPYRFQGSQKALSESALQTSGEESEIVKVEEEEEDETEEPVRKGPGRKKRTAPILVETEDGETKYVTPTEFRKLRRRITNRLSARRMRKKHAEERNVTQTATRTLEEERNHYKQACEQMQLQLDQMELVCQRLQCENQSWKSHWGRISSEPQLQLLDNQELANLGLNYSMQGLAPLEPLTPGYIRPPIQIAMPTRPAFDSELQAGSLDSLASPHHLSPHIPGMPFIPLNPGSEFQTLEGRVLMQPGTSRPRAGDRSPSGQPFSGV